MVKVINFMLHVFHHHLKKKKKKKQGKEIASAWSLMGRLDIEEGSRPGSKDWGALNKQK